MSRRIVLLSVIVSFLTVSCGLLENASGDEYDELVFLTLTVDATTCSSGTSGFAIEASRNTRLEATNNGAATQATLIQNSDAAGVVTDSPFQTISLPASGQSEHTVNVPAGTYSFDCGNQATLINNFTVGEVSPTPPTETEDASIEVYWTDFTSAVAQRDSAKLASLSLIPLPLGETGDTFTEEDFTTDFDTVFDSRLATTTVGQLEKLVMVEEFSARYNTPVGQEIYQVGFEEGGVSQTYVFGLEGAEYKLRSVILLQQ